MSFSCTLPLGVRVEPAVLWEPVRIGDTEGIFGSVDGAGEGEASLWVP